MNNYLIDLFKQTKSALRPYGSKLRQPLQRCLLHTLRRLALSSEIIAPPQRFYQSTLEWIANCPLAEKTIQTSYITLHPCHQICRTEPGRLDKEVHWKFKEEYERESPETFVVEIPHGRVWGQGGAIIAPDDKLLADLSRVYLDLENIYEHPIFSQWTLPPLHSIDGTVAVLSTVAGQGYFHWMCDVLPRIELLRMGGIDFNAIDNFLVNAYQTSFQQETLNTLDIPQTKIIESIKCPHIKATQLVVPSLAGISGNIPKWACDFLRNTFLLNNKASCKINTSELPERIYISRTRTNNRKIINEPELIQFLTSYGFRTIFLESMSVNEQALLFSKANFIVAPHGAGLTNLVFCSSGTKVIEIFSPSYVNVCYYALSNQVGLDYYYLLGEGKRPPDYVDPGLGRANIRINLDSLSSLFKLIDL